MELPQVSTRMGQTARLPDFLVIGAMKSGTTALYSYLRAHPDVFMPPIKEPNFFNEERNWHRGLAWYESLFAKAGTASVVGEASTNYTKAPKFGGVPARIAQVIPEARFIYLVRHPVERIRSQYAHSFLRGKEKRPINEAAITPRYIDPSRYAFQLGLYREHFSASKILVVRSERLLLDRAAVMSEIFAFIGVDPAFRSESLDREAHVTEPLLWHSPHLKRFSGRVPRSVAESVPSGLRSLWRAKTRSEHRIDYEPWEKTAPAVAEILRPDVELLAETVGPDIDGWGLL